MKITYYYPFGYFYPVRSGSAMVAAHHLRYFKSRGMKPRIVVLTNGESSSRAEFERYYHWVEDIHVVSLRRYGELYKDFSRWSFGTFLRGHHNLTKVREFRKSLRQPADLVFLNYAFSSPLLDLVRPEPARVLEAVDIISRQFLMKGSGRALLEHHLRTEFDLYSLYDSVVMINTEEAEFARHCGVENATYVPRAVETIAPDGGLEEDADAESDLLFVGSDHPPNVEGAKWFYEHIYAPYLRAHGVRWTIVGSVCNSLPIRDSGVKCVRYVEDLWELYRRTKITVIPLLQGAGISIKTLEAMGQGKPIVTSPCGRRGLHGSEDALIGLDFEENPRAVAERILELCRSPEQRASYGRRALEYVRTHFGVEAYGQRMDSVLAEATERARRRQVAGKVA